MTSLSAELIKVQLEKLKDENAQSWGKTLLKIETVNNKIKWKESRASNRLKYAKVDVMRATDLSEREEVEVRRVKIGEKE